MDQGVLDIKVGFQSTSKNLAMNRLSFSYRHQPTASFYGGRKGEVVKSKGCHFAIPTPLQISKEMKGLMWVASRRMAANHGTPSGSIGLPDGVEQEGGMIKKR